MATALHSSHEDLFLQPIFASQQPRSEEFAPATLTVSHTKERYLHNVGKKLANYQWKPVDTIRLGFPVQQYALNPRWAPYSCYEPDRQHQLFNEQNLVEAPQNTSLTEHTHNGNLFICCRCVLGKLFVETKEPSLNDSTQIRNKMSTTFVLKSFFWQNSWILTDQWPLKTASNLSSDVSGKRVQESSQLASLYPFFFLRPSFDYFLLFFVCPLSVFRPTSFLFCLSLYSRLQFFWSFIFSVFHLNILVFSFSVPSVLSLFCFHSMVVFFLLLVFLQLFSQFFSAFISLGLPAIAVRSY